MAVPRPKLGYGVGLRPRFETEQNAIPGIVLFNCLTFLFRNVLSVDPNLVVQ